MFSRFAGHFGRHDRRTIPVLHRYFGADCSCQFYVFPFAQAVDKLQQQCLQDFRGVSREMDRQQKLLGKSGRLVRSGNVELCTFNFNIAFEHTALNIKHLLAFRFICFLNVHNLSFNIEEPHATNFTLNIFVFFYNYSLFITSTVIKCVKNLLAVLVILSWAYLYIK